MVKFFTAPKNKKALPVYITALSVGVQLTTLGLPSTVPTSLFSCSIELDKSRTLEDPEAICRMLLTKNAKLKFLPDQGTSEYYAAEELLEKIHADIDDTTAIAKLAEQRLSHSQFLVGDKLTLVDICAWCALLECEHTLSGPVAQWFRLLADEKFFKAGVKAAGF